MSTTKAPTCLLLVWVLSLGFFTTSVLAQKENLPWGVERIGADEVWDTDWIQDFVVNPDANAGQGVRVAVIDTGIANHSDLEGRVVDGISYGIGEYWEDYGGHGTMVAGTIAAIDNGNHLIGASPRVSLYAVKPWSWDSIIDGINWAVNKGANIISMSFGFHEYEAPSGYLDRLRDACDNAYYNMGVLLIAASGNNGENQVLYPAAFDSVIAVGAIVQNQNDDRASFSNYGGELDFVAPGVNINSTFPPNTYKVDTGTSFAVPHVAGTAALIFASKVDAYYDSNGNGRWDNFEVREKLKGTALDLGGENLQGRDDYYGFGLVNAWYSNQRPPGDVNYDLMVDITDLTIVCYYYGQNSSDPLWWYWRRADINIDKYIDIGDMTIVCMHFGEIDP